MGKHKEKSKKHKKEKKSKHKKHKRRHSSSSSNSSSEDEWVEKKPEGRPLETSSTSSQPELKRDDWFSLPNSFLTTSNHDRRREKEIAKRLQKEEDKYDPGRNVRELNPYWKDGGDGLPSKFKKPSFDDEEKSYKSRNENSRRSSGWRKPKEDKSVKEDTVVVERNEVEVKVLTDKELNALAAKLVKAEIMGNTKLIAELKTKLEMARELRESNPQDVEEVLLTRTDSKGFAKPVKLESDHEDGSKKKKQKVETHQDGERLRYFADDDKYSLKQMFENEKFNSVEEQNAEFAKLAGKIRKNDDLDEIFTDNIRTKESDAKLDKRNRDKAIAEHQRTKTSLDNCNKCLQLEKVQKHLMITLGSTIYLALPPFEPLTEGHCLLMPIRHAPCSTQLDENEFSELLDFRRALTNMFLQSDQDVIFFETAMYLNHQPHMFLDCVPLPKEVGDLAPIYFKKAIDESETEWATNKKLISLAGRNVCKAIPKGLPYFAVSFGMEEGYGHVIEDQEAFPRNFAQEVIGGMLDLHHSKWRRPKVQGFEEQRKRVLEFSKGWKEFDVMK